MIWLYVIICIVAWGCWGVVQKLAVKNSSPLMAQVISAYVYSIVGPVIFLYMKSTGKETTWTAAGIGWTTLASVLVVAGALAFSTAVQRAPVGGVVGLTSAYPVLTFALGAVLLGEPVTLRKLVGIAVVSAGIIILSW